MADGSKDPNDKYPALRTTSEARRLRAQHELCTAAVGGLILTPIDFARPDLRILDSGTADGYFLVDLYSHLPQATRDSAELIGTDIASYPEPVDFKLPPNVKLSKQNILEPWPESWKGSFDLVCQRNTMANAGNFETAVDVVRKLAELVKPGGHIQLVDGLMPVADIMDDDPPSQKLFKTMGNFLKSRGLDTTMGWRLSEMLEKAGVVEVQKTEGLSRLGRGAEGSLKEAGYVQLYGLESACQGVLENMPQDKRPITVEQWRKLAADLLAEAEETGVDMTWYGAWGKVI